MKKIQIGLLGCGRIGIMHAKNIVNLVQNADLAAAADPYMSHETKNILYELGVKLITKDINKVINSKKVDAIFIATPTFTHIEIIKKIISTVNKPIFCEKPLSTKWQNLIPLQKEIEKYKSFVQVGYNRRFDINFANVKKAVKENKIGKIYMITITSFDPKPPNPKFIAESGMLWTDMNIHDFDMIRNVSGDEIDEVYVSGANLVSEDLKGIDVDVSIINIKLKSKALAVVKTTRKSAYGYDQRIEILGEKGRIKIENVRPTTIKIDTAQGRYEDKAFHTFIERYPIAYKNEIEDFVNNIINKSKASVSIEDDIKALQVAQACEISYKKNRPIKISEIQKGE